MLQIVICYRSFKVFCSLLHKDSALVIILREYFNSSVYETILNILMC